VRLLKAYLYNDKLEEITAQLPPQAEQEAKHPTMHDTVQCVACMDQVGTSNLVLLPCFHPLCPACANAESGRNDAKCPSAIGNGDGGEVDPIVCGTPFGTPILVSDASHATAYTATASAASAERKHHQFVVRASPVVLPRVRTGLCLQRGTGARWSRSQRYDATGGFRVPRDPSQVVWRR